MSRKVAHQHLQSSVSPEHHPSDNLKDVDAGHYIGMSAAWLRVARRRGYGPAYVRLGKKAIRYPRAALDAFMAANTIEPKPARRRTSDAHAAV